MWYIIEMAIQPGAQPKIDLSPLDSIEVQPEELMRGIDELLSLITEIYGKEFVQPIAARHAK